MTIIGYQFDKSKVTPESDAALYSYLAQSSDNKVISGMTATATGLNVYLAAGKALVQGRFVEVTQQHQLSAQANTSGYVVITIDLTQTNTATGIPGTGDYEPVNNQLRLELVGQLNQQDLNNGGLIYTLPLYSYVSTGTSVTLRIYKGSFKRPSSVTAAVGIGAGLDLSLERRGEMVIAIIGGTINSPLTSGKQFVVDKIPVGYRPNKTVNIPAHMSSSYNGAHIDAGIDGFCTWYGPATSSGYPRGTQMWFTDNPWPA